MSPQPRPESYSYWMKDIGLRIKWARELVEPNRAAFARAMGVDRSTIQKIEDGDRCPSIWAIIEIAQKLRVTPNYLLLGSLQGIDGELAYMLGTAHPELRDMVPIHERILHADKFPVHDTSAPPRKPVRA